MLPAWLTTETEGFLNVGLHALTVVCFAVFFFRIFKHFRAEGFGDSNDAHESVLQQWVILGTICSVTGILPYAKEIRAVLILGMISSPTKVTQTLYGPITSSVGSIMEYLFSHVRGIHESVHNAILRRVRLHLTPLWGPDGMFDVCELPDEEVEAVIRSLQKLGAELFRERKQRQKMAFSQRVGTPSQLYSTGGLRTRMSLPPQLMSRGGARASHVSGSEEEEEEKSGGTRMTPANGQASMDNSRRGSRQRRSLSSCRFDDTPVSAQESRPRVYSLDDREGDRRGLQTASEEKPRHTHRVVQTRSSLSPRSEARSEGFSHSIPSHGEGSSAAAPPIPSRDKKNPNGAEDSSRFRVKCGQHVLVTLPSARVIDGILRFRGRTQFYSGEWCGVELNERSGKNNGTVQGVEYFKCKQNYGLFVRPSALAPAAAARDLDAAEPMLRMGLRHRSTL